MLWISIVCVCILSVCGANDGNEGDSCVLPSGSQGRCARIHLCSKAVLDIKFRTATKICGFINLDPVVCCPKENIVNASLCPPLIPRRPNLKFGKKAYEKCIEYQEEVVYPCTLKVTRSGVVASRKGYDQDTVLAGVGGRDARRGQFPYMALLGYGKNISSSQWLCGGTIVSDRFILTAGHCTYHRVLGQVTFARVGFLKRSDPWRPGQLYRVARAVTHPEYRPPIKYNDIALLETEKRIIFVHKLVSPACLEVEDAPRDAVAPGWGALAEGGSMANVLQIMELTRFSHEECSRYYNQPMRLMPRGIDNHTQACYGHRRGRVDTCMGDSGGPLLRGGERGARVAGVTSSGRGCGGLGVYTRVTPYVEWVEGVVWP